MILYVNNRQILRVHADKLHYDLSLKGIHPNGKCGFEFNIEGVVDLKPADVVQVRAEGNLEFLPYVSGANKITNP